MPPGAAGGSAPLCYRSRDDLLDCTDAPVRQVAGEILRGVCSVVAAVNDLTSVQFRRACGDAAHRAGPMLLRCNTIL